jgi:hypothetical protein
LPSVDPCRTKYTVFIAARLFAPTGQAGLSLIEVAVWLALSRSDKKTRCAGSSPPLSFSKRLATVSTPIVATLSNSPA